MVEIRIDKELTLYTEAWYDAAHHLENYDGACSRLHGHTYKAEVFVKGNQSQLQKNGILWDFKNIKDLVKKFDHTDDLTKIMGKNSTAENQALYFYGILKEQNPNLKFRIRIYEQLEPKRSYCEVGDF